MVKSCVAAKSQSRAERGGARIDAQAEVGARLAFDRAAVDDGSLDRGCAMCKRVLASACGVGVVV